VQLKVVKPQLAEEPPERGFAAAHGGKAPAFPMGVIDDRGCASIGGIAAK
jgi:hypothetical protein